MVKTTLESRLALAPIAVPKSPYWDALQSFGRDEAIAMVINILGTAGMEFALHRNGTFSDEEQRALLAIAGPVIEKLGFFPAHAKEAHDIYRTTPVDQREPYGHYVKLALKNGSKSLLKDVLIHDPLYASMMYTGLQFNAGTPAWLIATVSFISAVFVVAGLDVAYDQTKYWNLARRAKKAGLGIEDYLESRFLVSDSVRPEQVLEKVAGEFSLSGFKEGNYRDRYFEPLLPDFSKKAARVRLRERRLSEEEVIRTAQIVYTRATEMALRNPSQFRYFPVEKRKIYFLLNEQKMPESVEQIENDTAKQFFRGKVGAPLYDIQFKRMIAKDPALLVAADQVEAERPFNVVELKTRNDPKLLQEAMRYVMLSFPVLQTTYGKADLTTSMH